MSNEQYADRYTFESEEDNAEAMDFVLEIERLRTRIAELEGTWTLCSERLPEKEGYEFWETKMVLVDWDKPHIAAMHWQGGWYSGRHDWTQHVIAWKDMPQITNPPEPQP